MKKTEFREAVEYTGSSLTKAAKHLGISPSTISRWTDDVPRYAEWYARSRSYIAPPFLTELDNSLETGEPMWKSGWREIPYDQDINQRLNDLAQRLEELKKCVDNEPRES